MNTPTPSSQAALAVRSDQEAVQLREDRETWAPLHRSGTASSNRPHSIYVRFWRRHISVRVDHTACRDHWANERTALSYFRTAQAFSMLGVVIAQLMRLNTNGDPDPHFGDFRVSIPLAGLCHACAIVIVLVGILRFFHWQHEMALGYALSSGWELITVFVLSLSVLVSLFVIVLVISVRRPA